MTELKPCPCCEGKAKYFVDTMVYSSPDHIVYCTNCGLRVTGYNSKKEAMEAWNRRPSPWHTEPPTEEGDYVVSCSTDGEYMVCHLEANLEPEIFHRYFKAWYGQKIEPYKEEK